MVHIVREAVKARRDRGLDEATFQASRELKISPRRVMGFFRNEVRRVWADELQNAQRWYDHHCELQQQRCDHEREIYRARRAELQERLRP